MSAKRLDLEINVSGRNLHKCGIFGCGKTGTTIAYSLLHCGGFSDLVLADPSPARAAEEAQSLARVLPFHTPMDIYAGDEKELADCGLIVFALECSGSAQLLAKTLWEATKKIIAQGTKPILINAAAPMEPLTEILRLSAGVSAGQVLGTGNVTDTLRLQKMLGRHLGVDSAAVNVFLIGESGAAATPIWSRANVAGIDLARYCELCGRGYDVGVMDRLFRTLREPTAPRFNMAGAYATAGAVRRIVSAIVQDENAVLTVTVPANGHYGIDDISLCLPCLVGRCGIRRVLEIPLEESEEKHLRQTAERLNLQLREIL